MVGELAYNDPDRKHKHKGVTSWKKGHEYLRLHKVSVKHKDKVAQMHHNFELGRAKKALGEVKPKATKKKTTPKVKEVKDIIKDIKSEVKCPVDDENFIRIDLNDSMFNKYAGVRVKFVRKEGRKKRTVGLEIEK